MMARKSYVNGFPWSMREPHWERTAGRCWYCGSSPKYPHDKQLDHVVPRFAGGTDETENLVPCCPTCNVAKRQKTVEEFREAEWRKRYRFTELQTEYLASIGIDLPAEVDRPRFVFAFEREGWR